jgi:putative ABC transport system permease protein
MMRCLGATQADLFAIHAWQFVVLGLAACALGSLAGYAAQGVLARWLTGFFTVTLPLPGPLPALRGAVIGFVLLLGFTMPPLLRLRNVSTLRVLRRDLAVAEPLSAAAFVLGLAALSALIVWQAGEVKLGSIALGGFGAALAVAAIAGYAMIRLVSRLRGAASGPWRYGLANLRRRTGASLVQIMALGLGLMAMLMLTLVRTELITKWQESMPPDMPNRFAINIQSDQLAAVKKHFAELKLVTPDLYPMVRGRLMAIGDRDVAAGAFKDERAKRLVEREFNLSWAAANRPDNKIVAGTFWTPDTKEPQFSVEEGLAKTLDIKVGDMLTFDVAGSRFTAKTTSLRKVDWDSFKPNFFVIASPSVLESYPASWITSFHLPSGRDDVVTGLVREFPNVSVIDLSALMAQFQRITDQVSRAVEFVFLFAIAAGLVVLVAAISSTRLRRRDPADTGREPPPAHGAAACGIPHHRIACRSDRVRWRRLARDGPRRDGARHCLRIPLGPAARGNRHRRRGRGDCRPSRHAPRRELAAACDDSRRDLTGSCQGQRQGVSRPDAARRSARRAEDPRRYGERGAAAAAPRRRR